MNGKISGLLSAAAVLLLIVGVYADNDAKPAKAKPGVIHKDATEKIVVAEKIVAVENIDSGKSATCPDCAAGKKCAACEKASKKIEPKWHTDFKKASALAKKQKRPMLVNFSGSDWCHWCIKLDQEVLTKDSFKKYAHEKLVLVSADFPRGKKQTEAVKKQNEALAQKFQVRGFPTVMLLDPEGKVLAQTGYRKGGPDVYVKHLEAILKEAKKKAGEKSPHRPDRHPDT